MFFVPTVYRPYHLGAVDFSARIYTVAGSMAGNRAITTRPSCNGFMKVGGLGGDP
jgi:hypothetical protein